MAISKQKKGEIVEELGKALKDAKSLVFVNFHGLKVSDTTNLRRALKSEGVSYQVSKKTLTKRVLDAEKFEGAQPELSGELAMAWGEDEVAPARGIYNFAKKFPEALKILGGVFGGKYMNAAEMTEIAAIPSMDVLRGKFVNIINSPIQRFAIALNEVAKKTN
ncbi:50S ribosomal protein L10 [Candidatus Parcubacteria bacterium]|nr:50S ribosomal protein L10 [Candidatus Parcubacteria bacterium]